MLFFKTLFLFIFYCANIVQSQAWKKNDTGHRPFSSVMNVKFERSVFEAPFVLIYQWKHGTNVYNVVLVVFKVYNKVTILSLFAYSKDTSMVVLYQIYLQILYFVFTEIEILTWKIIYLLFVSKENLKMNTIFGII